VTSFFAAAGATFLGLFVLGPAVSAFLRLLGVYTVVREREARVYQLFGKVIAVVDEPGLHLLWFKLGWRALLVNWLGECRKVDLRLDQVYLRSQPVNSEEGAPMGIGIWYEMLISDPVAYLFKNADPRGSLSANVSNATVRSLSNLKLSAMLEDRHAMSLAVRREVGPKSREWGYRLGSVYIRKVHFRDHGMIRQIEEKVVNRLKQVTSAIKQDGANQVSVIRSTAERQAAIEFAKAAAMRPRIVGEALHEITRDPEIARTMFELLELQNLIEGEADITLVPAGNELIPQLIAAEEPARRRGPAPGLLDGRKSAAAAAASATDGAGAAALAGGLIFGSPRSGGVVCDGAVFTRCGFRMGRGRSATAVAFLGLIVGAGMGRGVSGADPELRPEELPHFPPVEPGEALGTFEIRPGFRLEWAAHEPEVMDPIAVSFDERGRLYVVEMRDYSERRPERLGRIRRLEDRDGDGRYETSGVYVDGLPWPTAVTCWDGGVFVGATPDLIYAKDTDGDGKADVKEVVFTGFASDSAPYETNRLNVQAMFNSFQWGLDNRVHGSSGLAGGRVQRVDSAFVKAWRAKAGARPDEGTAGGTNVVHDVRGRDFSFDPRTLEFRLETGGGQYGMSLDDTGRKFLCSNSDHLQVALYEDRYSARNPWQALPSPRASIAVDGPAAEVFRISPDEPWRVIRTRWRVTGLVPGLVEGGGRVSGYFTSATGLTVYRGDAYGADYAGDVFVADCGSNLIHRKKLRTRGCEVWGERPADERKREFLASRDTWFRPVQFANAPDGCLWVIDMYREIIEHPWSLPPNLKRLLDLNAGNDRGRLIRIVPAAGTVRRRVDLSGASVRELTDLLGHPNGWHRDTAARLLVERRDPAAVAPLRETLAGAPSARARLHALQVLETLASLPPKALEAALRDPSPDVRRHALRLLELRVGAGPLEPAVEAGLAGLTADEAPVRLQLAFSLGTLRPANRVDLLGRLLRSVRTGQGEDLLVAATLASAGEEAGALFRSIADNAPGEAGDPGPLAALAEMIGRRNRPEENARAVEALGRLGATPAGLRLAVRWADGLRRGGGRVASADGAAVLQPLRAYARTLVAVDAAAGGEPAAGQVEAIRFLGHQPPAEVRDVLRPVLAAGRAPAARRAAVEEILRSDEAGNWETVLASWPALEADTRTIAVGLVLQRGSGPNQVLSAIAERRILPGDLSAAQLTSLRGASNPTVRSRAVELLGAPAASRNEAVAAMLPALNLTGDPVRGRAVHEAQCASCHRLGGAGFALGPDLESIRSQPKEKLLVAIVDPNREVAPNYLATTLETTDDESFTGLAGAETGAGIVLRQASGVEQQIPRSRIRQLKPEGRSVMPEGFETTLTPQAMADLLACLTALP
jgi:putative membrane-bound dehydrogenase-like protein